MQRGRALAPPGEFIFGLDYALEAVRLGLEGAGG